MSDEEEKTKLKDDALPRIGDEARKAHLEVAMTLVLQNHPLSSISVKEALPELAPIINFFTMNDWDRFKQEFAEVRAQAEDSKYEAP